VVEHAVVLLEPGSDIQPEDIPFIGEQRPATEPAAAAAVDVDGPPGESYHAARERLLSAFERRYLARLVQQAGGNMSKAARIAGVDRTTLYRLMERHSLERHLLAPNNGD
jgi:DNA-binding NtrC family response regulator